MVRGAETRRTRSQREWGKLVSDMAAACSQIFRAKGKLNEPAFPDKGLKELLRLAFRGRVIDSEDHPAVK